LTLFFLSGEPGVARRQETPSSSSSTLEDVTQGARKETEPLTFRGPLLARGSWRISANLPRDASSTTNCSGSGSFSVSSGSSSALANPSGCSLVDSRRTSCSSLDEGKHPTMLDYHLHPLAVDDFSEAACTRVEEDITRAKRMSSSL